MMESPTIFHENDLLFKYNSESFIFPKAIQKNVLEMSNNSKQDVIIIGIYWKIEIVVHEGQQIFKFNKFTSIFYRNVHEFHDCLPIITYK